MDTLKQANFTKMEYSKTELEHDLDFALAMHLLNADCINGNMEHFDYDIVSENTEESELLIIPNPAKLLIIGLNKYGDFDSEICIPIKETFRDANKFSGHFRGFEFTVHTDVSEEDLEDIEDANPHLELAGDILTLLTKDLISSFLIVNGVNHLGDEITIEIDLSHCY